jgi:two-component system, cell cycle sensor histidine kinase and response regulator CckA
VSEPPPLLDDRLRELFEHSSDALFVTTPEGRVLDCNRSAAELFGHPVERLVGMHRTDLVVTGDQRLPEAVRRRDAAGMVRSPLRFQRADGSQFDGEVSSLRGRSPAGEDQVWVLVRDFSTDHRMIVADAELRRSNQLLRALSDAAFEAVFMHRDGVIWSANRAAEQYVGVGPDGLIGRRLVEFIPDDMIPVVMARITAGDDHPYDARAKRLDGSEFPVEVQSRTVPGEYGALRVVALRDLSVRRELEEQLRQAQKMDAIGRLAGGIAHDFNNLLAVILGATELAAMRLDPEHPSHTELADVIRAGERAAELTQQLLAFGRKQVLRPRVVDVNLVLAQIRSMLRRVVAEDIELELRPSLSPARIQADPAQLEQVVLNLVVNARDAMTRGGHLRIHVDTRTLDAAAARAIADLQPGPHVILSIADTGVGMDADTLRRAFEPFFTTKGPGQGTGLGLATVFGIVKQSGGAIVLDSEPGQGTTCTLYFPATSAAPEPELAPGRAPAHEPSAQTILVVEDDPQVRRIVVEILDRAGYLTVAADGPAAALELGARLRGQIDLLLTDVVMPGMSGKQLVDRLQAAEPTLEVLYMSGHTEASIVDRGVLAPGVRLLAKPIVRERLLAAVRSALATRPADR